MTLHSRRANALYNACTAYSVLMHVAGLGPRVRNNGRCHGDFPVQVDDRPTISVLVPNCLVVWMTTAATGFLFGTSCVSPGIKGSCKILHSTTLFYYGMHSPSPSPTRWVVTRAHRYQRLLKPWHGYLTQGVKSRLFIKSRCPSTWPSNYDRKLSLHNQPQRCPSRLASLPLVESHFISLLFNTYLCSVIISRPV